jgi:hypothetical protein
MLRYINLVLLTMLVVGCGCNRPPLRTGVDPRLRELVGAFMQDAAERNMDLRVPRKLLYSIQYGDTSDVDDTGKAIGGCYLTPFGNWIVLSPVIEGGQDLRSLVYHELGHCLLYQDHVEGIDTDIMNPRLPRSSGEEQWQQWVDTLFSRGIQE